ncbi:HAD family hydrolase [Phragmitibacter flavus]|uniref:HAD family hydrolase n=1 Tax=Phragmitibacter flavus TaxID=2576071 RepID=A0A5R8KES7_9BACT|nr:heavy metal translocating P-type ATPase metal-binding domain-containing protein [Phragmitibacter flavus]TLD70803.1 HAD family hydrolase [Phragmitibacter flavus]
MPNCLHCGNAIPSNTAAADYCCLGCAYVHDLLHQQGLDQFYDLRGQQPLPPVNPQTLRERDYSWLDELIPPTENKDVHLTLAVQGISCIGCVWLINHLFTTQPGAQHLHIQTSRSELHLDFNPRQFDLIQFAKTLQQFGYLVGKSDPTSASQVESSSFNQRLGLCAAFAMNTMAFSLPSYLGMDRDFMFASWFDIITACSATLSLLVGGSYFATRSYLSLRLGLLHMDTPITLGILAAWAGSMYGWLASIPTLKYFDFVSIFIFLMLGGRWLQQVALERNRRRLLQSSAIPEKITRIATSGTAESIPLAAIQPLDQLRINPGDICPVDSLLISPEGSLSLEWINGESQAATRTIGQNIPSGALNIGTQSFDVTASETWSQSLLQRLLQSREPAENAPLFNAALMRAYLIIVILIGIGGASWWWINGHDIALALQVMISVFVVSCPCALGVAAPYADDLAASWMERLGVFVRTSNLWPRLARIKKIIFDKTGTLTLENPTLTNPEALRQLTVEQRHALHHLTTSNLHPVSRSLFDHIGPIQTTTVKIPITITETTGFGLSYIDDDQHHWSLGRPGWRSITPSQQPGDTEFTCDGKTLAIFTFTDALRPETIQACNTLHQQGHDLYLFSGDREQKVALIASTLHIPPTHWHSQMTPQDKAQRVHSLNQLDTLFIGDGANDSLAIEAALCAGSPVTGRNFLEHKADFYFLGNSLRFIPTLLNVAHRRRRAVRSVFAFALLYNLAAILLSLTGMMNPLLAAILMPASSAITLAIARAIFGKPPGQTTAMPPSARHIPAPSIDAPRPALSF